jgi:hypothetical protein
MSIVYASMANMANILFYFITLTVSVSILFRNNLTNNYSAYSIFLDVSFTCDGLVLCYADNIC